MYPDAGKPAIKPEPRYRPQLSRIRRRGSLFLHSLAVIIMVLPKLSLLGAAGFLTAVVNAQFPPTPEGVTVVESQLEEGVRISYKEVGQPHTYSLRALSNFLPRQSFAKPQKASEASPAMFISRPERSRTLAFRTKPTRSIRISGSSSPGKIPQMHHCQFG